MISILDYGVGNLAAFFTIYRRLNIPVEIASTVDQVREADHLILPGVGAFDVAMGKLNNSGMREALDWAVIEQKTPLLGVCVGMQMLADSSEEGCSSGLGYVPGAVQSMEQIVSAEDQCLPHMGWNNVNPTIEHSIWSGIDHQLGFYFLHSYCFVPLTPEHSIATTDYGRPFSCAVGKGNVYGFQFHPEKSLSNGVMLLKNFSELQPC